MLSALLLAHTALAGSTWLINDSFIGDSEGVYAQDGFGTFECWGVVFETDALTDGGPISLDTVRALISGSNASNTLIVQFYQMTTPDMNNAVLLGEEGISVTGSNELYNDLTISELKLGLPQINNGDVAVSMCLDETSTSSPSITNTDGFTSAASEDLNWIYLVHNDSWVKSSSLGVQGDWIMRLCVEGDHIEGSCDDDDTSFSDGSGDGDDGDGDGDGTGDALSLLQITPSAAGEGEAVDVVLLGAGFVDGAEARIGGISLTGAEVVNSETITGRTPTSLPAGEHDVEVVLPDGQNDYIAGGFTVTGGCGCSGIGSGGGLAALLIGLLAVVWRRQAPKTRCGS